MTLFLWDERVVLSEQEDLFDVLSDWQKDSYICWTFFKMDNILLSSAQLRLSVIKCEHSFSWAFSKVNHFSAERFPRWTFFQLRVIQGEHYLGWTLLRLTIFTAERSILQTNNSSLCALSTNHNKCLKSHPLLLKWSECCVCLWQDTLWEYITEWRRRDEKKGK